MQIRNDRSEEEDTRSRTQRRAPLCSTREKSPPSIVLPLLVSLQKRDRRDQEESRRQPAMAIRATGPRPYQFLSPSYGVSRTHGLALSALIRLRDFFAAPTLRIDSSERVTRPICRAVLKILLNICPVRVLCLFIYLVIFRLRNMLARIYRDRIVGREFLGIA